MSHVMVIAEAGVNHDGDIGRARRLIDVAADAGADAVKFQTFRATDLARRDTPKADYQKKNTPGAESSFEMLRKLELSEHDHDELLAHAKARGIEFLSTPFDLGSLALLTRRLGLHTIKLGSGEITNAPLLLAAARSADRVLLSTGMSSLDEVERALGVLAYGFSEADRAPAPGDFARAFASENGRRLLRERVTILHCTSEYPAPAGEVNLRAMDTLRNAFGVAVGFSDHTVGIHVALAAVARGATVIEKHFTTDRTLPGPDHAASIEPAELRMLVAQIREVEQAIGDGVKRATASESRNIVAARKSLVATKPIAAGELFSTDNVACKRPGSGLSPFGYWRVIGTKAQRSYAADEALVD